MATRPTKPELAKMKVMAQRGESPTSIANDLGRSHHTVKKWLLKSEVYTDPDVADLVRVLRDQELDDLYVLNAKARARLHEQLNEGKIPTIPLVAIADRFFQQRRLLENASTANLSVRGVVEHYQREIEAAQAALETLLDVDMSAPSSAPESS